MFESETRKFHDGEKDIRIWWVDDCFTTSSPDVTGGSLPFNNLDEWRDDDLANAPGVNPQVFLFLKLLAGKKEVSFHCASFEYADENWTELDQRNSLVLLDIGYYGNSETYGVNLWWQHTKGHKTTAKIRFLTGDQNRIQTFVRENGINPDNTPAPIKKEDNINFQNISESIIAITLNDLIGEQPMALGELTCEQWRTLRSDMKKAEIGFLKANSMGNKKRWAHHLPGGGNESDDENLRNSCIGKLLDACCHPMTRLPLSSTDYYWDRSPSKWQFPPTRALAQDDSWGEDVSQFFQHLETFIKKVCSDNVNVTMIQTNDGFKHVYLWFNVVALGEALRKLVIGFIGLCNNHGRQGTFQWTISELDGSNKNNKGIAIILEQKLNAKSPNSRIRDSESPAVLGDPVCFVPSAQAAGIVREAYKFFSNAGSEVEGCGDDSCCWRIVIKAKETDSVWAVACGEDGVS